MLVSTTYYDYYNMFYYDLISKPNQLSGQERAFAIKKFYENSSQDVTMNNDKHESGKKHR